MRRRGRALRVAALVAGVGLAPSLRAEEPEGRPVAELRLRHELLDAPSADPARDERYGFGNVRLRLGGDLVWPRWTIHGLVQLAGAYSLPANGSFGIGRVYFDASGGRDRSPGQFGLAELSVSFEPSRRFRATAGRIGLRDGAEVLTGDARFDWIKRARLAERLVGTWDWVNVGRRFDGASLSWSGEGWNLSGFGARVLQGGVDYDDAFERLDGVDVYGIVYTARRDAWLPSAEVRIFNVLYRDARPSTEEALGARLLVDTIGASLVGVYPAGEQAVDLLLWGALQLGDYGARDHRAAAFVAEGGYGWPTRRLEPWVRAGLAYGSGDGAPGDDRHATFFNLVPTNHKFYGAQDLSALQNLANVYGQLRLRPRESLSVDLEAHAFFRPSTADAWYGGSGPANDRAFGYAARSAPGAGRHIGNEIDLTVAWRARRNVALLFGASYFGGGSVARAVFPEKSDFTWAFAQIAVTP